MIEIVKEMSELQSLRDQWNELADTMQKLLLRHEWIVTATRSFFFADELYFFVYREQGQLNAVAPLVKLGKGIKARLYLIGYPGLYEPADFLYRDAASLSVLMRALARQKIPVCFQRIPITSPVLDYGFWHIGSWMPQAKVKNRTFSPFLDIESDWRDFYGNLTSKNRNDLNRAYRKAEKSGPVSFDILQVNKGNNDQHFREFLSLEQRSWKAENGSAISSTKNLQDFFTAFTSVAAEQGYLYYAFMRINNRLVAAQFFVICYEKLWTLKIAHDSDYGYCSPGTVLMREVIRFAFEKGLKGVEFLGYSESWLKKWSTGVRCYVDFAYFPFSLNSVFSLVRNAKTGLHGVLRRVRLIRQHY
jgi:hypothetical protein